jgi:hypothetical protein
MPNFLAPIFFIIHLLRSHGINEREKCKISHYGWSNLQIAFRRIKVNSEVSGTCQK